MPLPESLDRIARAVSVPLEALFCEDGYCPLATFVIGPESLARLHGPDRARVLDELQAVLSSQIRMELEKASPLLPPVSGDVRRRRTREQVLAAQTERLKALNQAKRSTRRQIT